MTWPNFLVIGAARAGTTSLYHYLGQHPDVYMSPIKEPNYFAVRDMDHPLAGPGDQGWFQNSVSDTDRYLQLFQGVEGERAIGEASPTYMHYEPAAEAIQETLPDVRLLAILRDPAERAFSHYRHHVREGREVIANFQEALEAERERLDRGWFWPRYLTAGFYHRHLRRFADLFAREQIKIVLYADFARDPHRVMRDVYSFLDVDRDFEPDVDHSYNRTGKPRFSWLDDLLGKKYPFRSLVEPVVPAWLRSAFRRLKNWNLRDSNGPSPADRRVLLDVYREDIVRLEEWLGRDLSDWTELG